MPPVLQLDPFSDDAIANPYAWHDEVRDAGPVVYLERLGVYAMGRHAEVSEALKHDEIFCSSRGVGLLDFAGQDTWRAPSLLLETDSPYHDQTRSIMNKVVSPANVKALRPAWKVIADGLIEGLVAKREFDAVVDLAEVFPLLVFPDAIGIQDEGRENLLRYAAVTFNAFGPRNERYLQSVADAGPAFAWVEESRRRENLQPGGWGALVFEAADRGQCTHDEASQLVRAFLAAGVDTTINGIGNLLLAFAEFPEQWQVLRSDPSLVRRAVEEGLRWDSTVQTFFRTTTREVDVSGHIVPEGAKVLLLLASANRDPRRWENPDQFDIRRVTSGHVAFGFGIHQCLGQMVARLEAELVLEALVKRVEKIEVVSPPVRRLNNTLHALANLMIRVEPG